MLPYIVAAVVGYLLGSIPVAFLVVRWKSRIDIRSAGSGNVGTLNSYVVTKSKWVGALVLFFDLLKGMAAVFIAPQLGAADPFLAQSAAGVAAVAGHNFPVWLGGKGGRGLATAAGVMLPLQAWSLVLWVAAWAAGFLRLRKVNLANALATVVVIVVSLIIPGESLERFLPEGATVMGFRLLIVLVMSIVLVRHIGPVREYARQRRQKKGGAEQ